MCIDAEIDCYMKMPTNPPPVDPKGKMLLEQCEENDPILEPICSMKDGGFYIQMGQCVCLNESYIMFVGQIQNAAG